MRRIVFVIFVLAAPSIAEAGRYVSLSQGNSSCSGTLIKCGGHLYVLTSAHPLRDRKPVNVFPSEQRRGPSIAGRIVAIDRERDLAVIEYKSKLAVLPAPLADETPTEGYVQFIGFERGGRYHQRATKLKEPVTTTIEYSDHTAVRTLPRIDASGKPGDSGGAIMHEGHLIGVHLGHCREMQDGVFVPIEDVHEFLKECGLDKAPSQIR